MRVEVVFLNAFQNDLIKLIFRFEHIIIGLKIEFKSTSVRLCARIPLPSFSIKKNLFTDQNIKINKRKSVSKLAQSVNISSDDCSVK